MRTRTLAVGLVVVVTGIIGSSIHSAEPGKKDGERIKRLLGGRKIRTVQSLPGLTAQPMGRLIARTGIPTTVMTTIRRYEVDVEGELYPMTVALLDVSCASGKGRLGVGATRDGEVAGPTLFDDFGKEMDDLDGILEQFRGHKGVRLTEASLDPVGDVMTRRDEILAQEKAPTKKAEKKEWALFRHYRRMWEIEEIHETLQRARAEKTSMREPLRRLEEKMMELKPFASNLKGPLQPKDVGQYRKFVDEMLGSIEKAKLLVDKGNQVAASKVVKASIKITCGKCHGWDKNKLKKPLEGIVRDQREALGFRPGVFVVGVDLEARDLEPADAQLVASTVKAAMLLAGRAE